jgi:hypothetical protein
MIDELELSEYSEAARNPISIRTHDDFKVNSPFLIVSNTDRADIESSKAKEREWWVCTTTERSQTA